MNERQLHLFKQYKGKKRWRFSEPLPRAKEFELQCMVADVLRRWCDPAWLYTHMPMGEKRDPVTAMRLKRMGTTPHWPDFVFFGPRNAVVWMELKRPGGSATPSDEQDERARQLMERGHTYVCTNDFTEALDLLRDLGIVPARVSA